MSNFIDTVLTRMDNDLISYRDIDIYKKLNVTCLNKRYSISLLDYVYTYYQVFSNTTESFNFDLFSLLKGEKSIPENHYINIEYSGDDDYSFYYRRTGYGMSEDDNEETNPFLINFIKDHIVSVIKDTKYYILPLTLVEDESANAHQTGMIIENRQEGLTIAIFDPEGADKINPALISFGKVLKTHLSLYLNKPCFLMANSNVSRGIGIQGKINIPFCIMFTYMWFYVFINVCEKINKPMKDWINQIEESLTNHVVSKSDPKKYICAFSYNVVENILKYITTLEEDVDVKYEKSIIKQIGDIEDLYRIQLYKDKVSVNTMAKIIFCRHIQALDNLNEHKYFYDCEGDDECKKDEMCISKKCMEVPIFQNTYEVRDRNGSRVDDSILEKLYVDLDIDYDIDVDNNLVSYTDEQGEKVIDYRGYTLHLIESVKYNKKKR